MRTYVHTYIKSVDLAFLCFLAILKVFKRELLPSTTLLGLKKALAEEALGFEV